MSYSSKEYSKLPSENEMRMYYSPSNGYSQGSAFVNAQSEPYKSPNQTQTIELGDEPTVCYCPTCRRTVHTRIDKQPSVCQIVMVFLCWLFMLCFAVTWLLWPCLKSSYHVCTRCRTVIGKKGEIVALS